jgi:DNA modification methylase
MTNKNLEWHTEQRKVNDLIPWEKNPRQMTEKQAKDLRASLERLNLISIPAINIDNTIISGHQRMKIMQLLGRGGEIIDVRVPNRKLAEAEVEEANLRENKNIGEWDFDVLASFDIDLLKGVGWGDEELKDIFQLDMGGGGEQGNTDPDAVPEPPVEPESRYGDLFQLGRHRMLCGDSTRLEDVERLMGGEKADMVFTSPPYADQREYHIGNFPWDKLMLSVFGNIVSLIADDRTHILVNLGLSHKNRAVDVYWGGWLKVMSDRGYPLFGWYVWDKGCGMPGEWSGRLAPAHEFIFHFNKRCGSANKWVETKYDELTPERIEHAKKSSNFRQKDGTLKHAESPDKFGQPYKIPDSVIRVSRAVTAGSILAGHPAVFPVNLPEFGCRTWTKEDDLVFEPFGGSGSTLIACERTNRRCRLIEIDPVYVDIIIARWEKYTGEGVVKIS